MGCFSGRLMSSASDQKLFCGVCSAFKCSLDEFVGEKVVSPSYSSAILAPPPTYKVIFYLFFPPVRLPSKIRRLLPDPPMRGFPGVWKLPLLRLLSQDGSSSLALLSLFLSFIFCPTSFRRQWASFLGAWCPLLAIRSCFVKFAQRWIVLLMNL